MSIKEQSLTGVKWNALGHFFTHGVNFVLGLLIARMLMPEDYGVIGMLAIFTAIANAFVDSGASVGGDVDIGGTVELDVVVIHLVAVLVGEHVVDVLVVVDDNVRHLKVL